VFDPFGEKLQESPGGGCSFHRIESFMKLSIIVPAFNEEALVGPLLEKVAALVLPAGTEKEIVVVDDGSSDGTVDRIREIEAKVSEMRLIVHERNRGKGAAVRTGFEAASGDVMIVQDADLEYDPEDISKVALPVIEGDEQVVYGSRILMEKALGRSGVVGLLTGKHPHSYVLAYLGGVVITRFVNLLTGASLTDEPTCYKCFQRSVLQAHPFISDDFSWEPEITMKILTAGIRIHEVPIAYHPRKNDEGKKINWRHGVAALWTIWKYR
jgi:glycosyltransferase involved in cell wall biosynthesis